MEKRIQPANGWSIGEKVEKEEGAVRNALKRQTLRLHWQVSSHRIAC